MSTCATCRHWTPPSERTGYADAITYQGYIEGQPYTRDLSDRAIEKTRASDVLYGECGAIELCDDMPVDREPPLATVRDGSDYMATLFTQAEFGCALWAAKEER